MEPISVILTVRNDSEALGKTLTALSGQTRLPDEIVIADAGLDGTVDAVVSGSPLAELVRLVPVPGSNISEGRNAAIAAVRTALIACTDAGCMPQPEWLDSLAAALVRNDFVVGLYVVAPQSIFEELLAVSLYPDPDEVGSNHLLLRLSHRLFGRDYAVEKATGRSMAFHKRAWVAVGGFPEELFAGEDITFAQSIVRAGFRTALVPQAQVYWFPRATVRRNLRMFRLYARGGVRGGSAKRDLVRAAAYLVAVLGFVAGGKAMRTAISAAFLANVALPLVRASRRNLGLATLLVPAVVVGKDLAMLIGAVQGKVDERSGRRQPHGDRL
jgi:GT2 family glycosyltransferase